jgi:hypothetical protein
MQRKPDGRLVRRGPLDAVTAMRRDVHIIAGPQIARVALAFEAEVGGTSE